MDINDVPINSSKKRESIQRNEKIERVNTGTIYYEDLYPLGFCLLISAITMVFLFLWPTKEILPSFRNDCCQLLFKIGYTPGEKKQAAMYHALRHDFKKCEQIGASAVGPLIEALEHLYEIKYDERQRESVCYSLGQINDVSAVDCLVKVLKNDDNNKVRKVAALALKNIDYHSENDETRALFFIAQSDYVKCAELGVLGIDYLVNWLQHSSYGSDETCYPDKIEYDTYRSSKTGEYSCEKIRYLAKEELKHRGFDHI